MKKSNKMKSKGIWLSVLLLFICAAATTIALVGRMDMFLLSDEGAIPLIPEPELHASQESQVEANDPSHMASDPSQSTEIFHGASGIAPSGEAHSASESISDTSAGTNDTSVGTGDIVTGTTDTPAGAGGDTALQETVSKTNPGFEASDNVEIWNTGTRVDIFRISYENGEQVVTVNSDNGDKVIAPGTKNSYTFKLKNTGDVALDYTVSIDAYFTPGDVAMPITGRLSRHDGKWIVGNTQSYGSVADLDAAEDSATLSQGRYGYYVLDWEWPYESGDDGWDTWLGDLAVSQELTFTIVITTTATESTNPGANIGIVPKTGDVSMFALWIALAVSSLLIMVLLIAYKVRESKSLPWENIQEESGLQE